MKKMEILGHKNPFSKLGKKKQAIFIILREGERRRSNIASITFPGYDRINIPKIIDGKPDFEQLEETTIAYVKGANSIFADEIMAQFNLKSIDELYARTEDFFYEGMQFVVPATETNKMAYIRATNYNRDAIGRIPGSPKFYEFDEEVVSKQRVEKALPSFQVLADVVNQIENNQHNQLYAMYAYIHDISIEEAQRRATPYQLQDFMLDLAKNNPQSITDIKTSEKAINKIYLLEAFFRGELFADANNVVRNKKSKEICVVGQGGKPVDATLIQITPLDMAEIKKIIGPVFSAQKKKESDDNAEIARLRAENERMANLIAIGKNVDTKKLEDVLNAETKENIEHFINGLHAEGLIDKQMGKWFKDFEGNNILPPIEKCPHKAWSMETLCDFLHENPADFGLMKATIPDPA